MEKLSQARLLVLGSPGARQGQAWADAPSSVPLPLAERSNGWHWLVAVLFVLLLCVNGWGCGVGPEGPLVLSPTDEAWDETAAAAELWSAETGIPIFLGLGGVPVSFVEQSVDLDGTEACGVTVFWLSGRMTVQVTRDWNLCAARPLLVLHEIGHVICGNAFCHLEPGKHGIMGDRCNPMGAPDDIDTPSVDAVLHI